jgi:uncharacterized protein (TIGR03435 family)
MKNTLITKQVILGAAAMVAIGAASLWAQDAAQTTAVTPKALTFDAASVKVDDSGSGRNSLSINMEGGRLHAVNVPLATFMVAAYRIPSNRIIGAPSWFDSEYFDIEATHADPGPEDAATDDGNDLRLQALLADRFKLAIHHETRQLPVYALELAVPGKFGPQFQMNDGNCGDFKQTDLTKPPAASVAGATPSSINCGDFSWSGGPKSVRLLGRGITMAKLIQILSGTPSQQFVTRPIVDRTGLTGKVDFSMEFALPPRATSTAPVVPDPTSLPSFQSALRDELGLALKADTGPVDVIVIDHVEQPSAN